jgi:hypothetical protein
MHPRLDDITARKTWMASEVGLARLPHTMTINPAMTNDAPTLPCHARLYAGHPRLYGRATFQDVDGRDEPGHDVEKPWPSKGDRERRSRSRNNHRDYSF